MSTMKNQTHIAKPHPISYELGTPDHNDRPHFSACDTPKSSSQPHPEGEPCIARIAGIINTSSGCTVVLVPVVFVRLS